MTVPHSRPFPINDPSTDLRQNRTTHVLSAMSLKLSIYKIIFKKKPYRAIYFAFFSFSFKRSGWFFPLAIGLRGGCEEVAMEFLCLSPASYTHYSAAQNKHSQ